MKIRLIALLAALALLLGLAGCATTQPTVDRFNATAYVQGLLDETYTGVASDTYLALMDTDPEAVAETYQKNLRSEYANRFAKRFEIDDANISPDLRARFLELLDQVYAKARYTVKATVPLDDARYCVEVTVTPVTFFSAAYSDGFAVLVRNFERDDPPLTDEEKAELSPAQLRRATWRRENAWGEAVYEWLYGRAAAITTGAPVTKLLLVAPNVQGYYTVSSSDLQDLDDRILAY